MDNRSLGNPRRHQNRGDPDSQTIKLETVTSRNAVRRRNSGLRGRDMIKKSTVFVISDEERERSPSAGRSQGFINRLDQSLSFGNTGILKKLEMETKKEIKFRSL
jgi:hypothetical protein